jgi:hypothetical protein
MATGAQMWRELSRRVESKPGGVEKSCFTLKICRPKISLPEHAAM